MIFKLSQGRNRGWSEMLSESGTLCPQEEVNDGAKTVLVDWSESEGWWSPFQLLYELREHLTSTGTRRTSAKSWGNEFLSSVCLIRDWY